MLSFLITLKRIGDATPLPGQWRGAGCHVQRLVRHAVAEAGDAAEQHLSAQVGNARRALEEELGLRVDAITALIGMLDIATARKRVTLRQRRRGPRRCWDICARHRGELATRYLCADSALDSLSEDDFLRRVRSLPGRGDAAALSIAYLPGEALRVHIAAIGSPQVEGNNCRGSAESVSVHLFYSDMP